jgi:hypothetical protein
VKEPLEEDRDEYVVSDPVPDGPLAYGLRTGGGAGAADPPIDDHLLSVRGCGRAGPCVIMVGWARRAGGDMCRRTPQRKKKNAKGEAGEALFLPRRLLVPNTTNK